MALIERLTKTDPDGTRHIAVHEFAAAMHVVAIGDRTKAQLKSHYNMTVADETEFDTLVANAPPASQTANLERYINRIHWVLILGEGEVPTYATDAEIRTELGL